MKLPVTKHEDNRRVLVEYVSDIQFKRAKVMTIKEKCILGKHYHNKSDSVFYILKGKAIMTLWPFYRENKPIKITRKWIFEGDCEFVARGTIHTFEVYPGTIMLELASEPYDKEDEIQIPE